MGKALLRRNAYHASRERLGLPLPTSKTISVSLSLPITPRFIAFLGGAPQIVAPLTSLCSQSDLTQRLQF